ncbi:MAG: VWA domain-containing protein, partial [Phycisphaerales bacterium]
MVFAHPTVLWLLLLAVPLMAIHSRHRMGVSAGRCAVVAATRALAFVLLVAALAEPIVNGRDASETVVAVVDVSASVDDAALDEAQASVEALVASQGPDESVELVAFGPRARVVPLDADVLQPGGFLFLREETLTPEPGSALADALQLAGALIRHDGRGRIMLFSDGLETGGDALAIADRLARRGIGISVAGAGAARRREVILRSVTMPASAGVGATVALEAEIEASHSEPGTLVVRREEDGESIVTPVQLRAGRQRVVGPCPLPREGFSQYRVHVESATDTVADNNVLTAAIHVE